MVGAMEQMEVESATCSSRTLITGLPYSHMQMSDQIFLYGVIENHPPLHPLHHHHHPQHMLLGRRGRRLWHELVRRHGVLLLQQGGHNMRWLHRVLIQPDKTNVNKDTISRVTLLSRRVPTSRQRLRSTSRSLLHHYFQPTFHRLWTGWSDWVTRDPQRGQTSSSHPKISLTLIRLRTEEPSVCQPGGLEATICTRRGPGAGQGSSL